MPGTLAARGTTSGPLILLVFRHGSRAVEGPNVSTIDETPAFGAPATTIWIASTELMSWTGCPDAGKKAGSAAIRVVPFGGARHQPLVVTARVPAGHKGIGGLGELTRALDVRPCCGDRGR